MGSRQEGARVEGLVADADPGERVKGLASLSVTLESLTLADGRTVRLSASQFTRQAKTTKGKDAKKIGIGAGNRRGNRGNRRWRQGRRDRRRVSVAARARAQCSRRAGIRRSSPPKPACG